MFQVFFKFFKSCCEFLFEKFKKICQYFEQNTFILECYERTNIHGFNHIANRNYTGIERFKLTYSTFRIPKEYQICVSFQNRMANIGSVVYIFCIFHLCWSTITIYKRSIHFYCRDQLSRLVILFARIHNLFRL